MPVRAIVGTQWGDEGKGKCTDYFAEKADYVVRFQGGANAGHTIINDYGKFALHLLPSGVFYPHVTNILGHGVALNMRVLLDELEQLISRGVPQPDLRISDRAQVLLPIHLLLDSYEEERLGAEQFGSTKQGIAPFYADKFLKLGVQVADLYDEEQLVTKIERLCETKAVLFNHLYRRQQPTVDEIIAALMPDAEKIVPYVCDTFSLLQQAVAADKQILLEVQLGALRDPDHGIYPYSTSSSPLAGFAAVGAGIPPYRIEQIVGITKAYSSCVGAGPFVTRLSGEDGDTLRRLGGDAGEYGATTGRARCVGWFDAVATRYGCQVQGATAVALTNLDILGYLNRIPICIGYEIDESVTQHFPTTAKLDSAKPEFEEVAGWECDISTIRTWSDLPDAAKAYVNRIEELIETPITWLGVGPKREAMIVRH